MQHNLRDPSRDHTHGRVYRVMAEGRTGQLPFFAGLRPAGRPVVEPALKEPDARVRHRARIELLPDERPDQVIAGLKTWIAGLAKNDPEISCTICSKHCGRIKVKT